MLTNISTTLCFFQRTPLHAAAKKGRDDTVKCLVGKGADINLQDHNGVNTRDRHVLCQYLCLNEIVTLLEECEYTALNQPSDMSLYTTQY